MNIYVGNLSYQVKEEKLKETFSAHGAVDSARIITGPDGRSKGFGFVDMPNKEEAEKAIKELNGKELEGRAITVNEARPREEKPRGGHRSGGFRSGDRGDRGDHGGRGGRGGDRGGDRGGFHRS